MTRSHHLTVLCRIAEEAARTIAAARPKSIVEKSAQDFVTDMDRHIQERIVSALGAAFPGVPALGEESVGTDERLPDDAFLIDPLDGTGNWIGELPFSAVSIARISDRRSILAAVADIAHGIVYSAELGAGAYRGGAPMRIPAMPSALFSISTNLLDKTHAHPQVFAGLRQYGKFRNLGAQALNLCLVAQGTLAFSASEEARLWDDAAGRLIVAEAGGAYTAGVPEGRYNIATERQHSIAAHPAVYDAVCAELSLLPGMPKGEARTNE